MHHPTDRIAHTIASHGTLVGTRNNLMGPPLSIDLMTHCTMSGHSTMELNLIAGILNK